MTSLPEVDDFRRPFIEPLGYLTFFAAQSEHWLIETIAVLEAAPARLDTDLELEQLIASEKVRHWTEKNREELIAKIENGVNDGNLSARLSQAVSVFSALRKERNRKIHDAIEVGYSDADGAETLAVGYLKAGSKVDVVTPEKIIKLAVEFGDLTAELRSLEWTLRRYRESL